MNFDQSVQNSLERAREKEWARGIAPGSLSVREATAKVSEVFAEQMLRAPSVDEVGEGVSTGLLAIQEVFGNFSPTIDEVDKAIDRAREDYYVHKALLLLVHICSDEHYPNLANWKRRLFLGLIKEPARPRGQSKFKHLHRDRLIVSQIRQLEQIGFRPMRNADGTSTTSGCDIVAAAIGAISYDGVVSVWKKARDSSGLENIAGELMDQYASDLERRREN